MAASAPTSSAPPSHSLTVTVHAVRSKPGADISFVNSTYIRLRVGTGDWQRTRTVADITMPFEQEFKFSVDADSIHSALQLRVMSERYFYRDDFMCEAMLHVSTALPGGRWWCPLTKASERHGAIQLSFAWMPSPPPEVESTFSAMMAPGATPSPKPNAPKTDPHTSVGSTTQSTEATQRAKPTPAGPSASATGASAGWASMPSTWAEHVLRLDALRKQQAQQPDTSVAQALQAVGIVAPMAPMHAPHFPVPPMGYYPTQPYPAGSCAAFPPALREQGYIEQPEPQRRVPCARPQPDAAATPASSRPNAAPWGHTRATDPQKPAAQRGPQLWPSSSGAGDAATAVAAGSSWATAGPQAPTSPRIADDQRCPGECPPQLAAGSRSHHSAQPQIGEAQPRTVGLPPQPDTDARRQHAVQAQPAEPQDAAVATSGPRWQPPPPVRSMGSNGQQLSRRESPRNQLSQKESPRNSSSQPAVFDLAERTASDLHEFILHDYDGSNTLNEREFASLVRRKSRKHVWSEEDIARMFAQLDRDGNGRIDVSEYLKREFCVAPR